MSTSSLTTALRHALDLLDAQPQLAQAQARAILEAAPGHPQGLFVLAAALRRQGDHPAALDILHGLAASQPQAATVHLEYALALAAAGERQAARTSLQRALDLNPQLRGGWRLMGDLAFAGGDCAGADAAYGRHLAGADADAELMRAGRALVAGELEAADGQLRARLDANPTDVAALRMLAELETRIGRDAEAEALLAAALDRHPGFTLARHNYAVVLFRQNKPRAALIELDRLLAEDARNPNYRSLRAAALAQIGEYDAAIATYEALLAEFAGQAKVWMSYGHALKTAGRHDHAVAAYRTAISRDPGLGEAYWSLANMKTAALAAEDTAMLEAQLRRADLGEEDRFHMHYALGHLRERAGEFEASWGHYAQGAKLRRNTIGYDAERTTERRLQMQTLMTSDFFRERAGVGCADEAPIFVVGLPRSGSTLIEQILASHSTIEGTMELPEIADLARELGATGGPDDDLYPRVLAELSPAAFAELGARYLERTRIYRKTDRPVFIDKMPNNFIHVGLIHLILPRARIIDARRRPMAACFSAFKQHFARGQHFSYSLDDLGRYYRDYAALMAHFDATLPGRIHRVQYEDLVDDLETQTRHLLNYCDVPFEPACLRFHENTRAVRTASSEQVRRPIFREGLDQWRNYEPWLGPLSDALHAFD